jgi:hypothetical protein
MIARVWRGVVAHDRYQAYVAYVDATGVAEYRRAPGCRLSAILTRDLEPGDAADRDYDETGAAASARTPAGAAPTEPSLHVEVIAFSIWDSLSDIQAFAGHDINAMVLYPEDEHYLLEPPTLVHHQVTSFAVPTAEETS